MANCGVGVRTVFVLVKYRFRILGGTLDNLPGVIELCLSFLNHNTLSLFHTICISKFTIIAIIKAFVQYAAEKS